MRDDEKIPSIESVLSNTFILSENPREQLVSALSGFGDPVQARQIVDCLDAYLADGPSPPAPLSMVGPGPRVDVEKLVRERDEAVRRAEKAEEALKNQATPARLPSVEEMMELVRKECERINSELVGR